MKQPPPPSELLSGIIGIDAVGSLTGTRLPSVLKEAWWLSMLVVLAKSKTTSLEELKLGMFTVALFRVVKGYSVIMPLLLVVKAIALMPLVPVIVMFKLLGELAGGENL